MSVSIRRYTTGPPAESRKLAGRRTGRISGAPKSASLSHSWSSRRSRAANSRSRAVIAVCWPIADVTGCGRQACRLPVGDTMPLSRWFSGGRPRLKDRVVKGLQQARDGDVDGAIETIAERFHDALSELQARQPPQDSGWLRLAARLAYRAGDMPAAADYAQRALDR